MEIMNQTSEVKRALQEKVLLDDGRLGYVFSELVQIGPSNRWHCHVCLKTVDSERALVMHVSHPLHTVKLRSNKYSAKNFKKFADDDEAGPTRKVRTPTNTDTVQSSWEMITDVLPGEPVPPGMEDIVEGVCQIQTIFDEHPGPLIGLEYIVELVTSKERSEPKYICLLCGKKGDPRSLMVHVTSPSHCLKYISCFFSKATNALNMITKTAENRKGIIMAVKKIAQEIEKNYGRLKPTSAVAETFSSKKYEILRQIDEKEHFRETPSTTFVEYVSPESIREYCLQGVDFDPSTATIQKDKEIKIDLGTASETLQIKTEPEEPNDPSTSKESDSSNCLKKKSGFDLSTATIQKDKKIKIVLGTAIFSSKTLQIKTEPEEPNDPSKSKESDLSNCLKNKSVDETIEVTSSISSISTTSSLCSNDGRDGDKNRRNLSSERSSRKRRSTPDGKDGRRRRYSNSRRRLSRSRYSRSRSETRSRSRDRDVHRRISDYYRKTDRYERSRSSRSRYEDRISVERYRRRSPGRDEYDRERDRQRDRRRREDSRDRRERSLDRRDRSLEREDKNMTSRKESDDNRWDNYRAELHKLELSFDSKLKYYEEKPEKHPKYSEEWKGFWNKRYKEMQMSGKDPTNYDFKPEWIIYWAKRMKELNDEAFTWRRDILKKRMKVEDKPSKLPSSDLQDISPPTPESHKDITVGDVKNTWKALSGTEITAPSSHSSKRSLSPRENTPNPASSTQGPATDKPAASSKSFYDIAPPVLHCLRMLSIMEFQLGSLGPKVMELLSKALVLERTKHNSSMILLKDVNIHIFFETVKENIIAQLIAGIVMSNLVGSCRAVIKSINKMLEANPPTNKLSFATPRKQMPAILPTSEPVQVPGIGMIDKMAVAQQIAGALVAQGRTDVNQEELEDLINAVVGIAKASNANVDKSISSDAFFSQLNIKYSPATSHINEIISNMISSAQKKIAIDPKKTEETVGTEPVTAEKQSPVTSVMNALKQTVQSNDFKTNVPDLATNVPVTVSNDSFGTTSEKNQPLGLGLSKDISDEHLKEKLMKFSVISREEQQSLITLLKELETTQASRVENLRKYVCIGLPQLVPSEKDFQSKETSKDGRSSPFSSTTGAANPIPEFSLKEKIKVELPSEKKNTEYEDDDDDEDYNVEDVYKVASEKLLKRSESAKNNLGSSFISRNIETDKKGSLNQGFAIPTLLNLSSLPVSGCRGSLPPFLPGKSITKPLARQEGDIRNVHPTTSIDNTFVRGKNFSVNQGPHLGSKSEVGNNFKGPSCETYQESSKKSFQFNESNCYMDSENNKNQGYLGNNYGLSKNSGSFGYTSDPIKPSFESLQPPPMFPGENWDFTQNLPQFKDPINDKSKNGPGTVLPPINYQQLVRNPPPKIFYRGKSDLEPPFGGFRPNF